MRDNRLKIFLLGQDKLLLIKANRVAKNYGLHDAKVLVETNHDSIVIPICTYVVPEEHRKWLYAWEKGGEECPFYNCLVAGKGETQLIVCSRNLHEVKESDWNDFILRSRMTPNEK